MLVVREQGRGSGGVVAISTQMVIGEPMVLVKITNGESIRHLSFIDLAQI